MTDTTMTDTIRGKTPAALLALTLAAAAIVAAPAVARADPDDDYLAHLSDTGLTVLAANRDRAIRAGRLLCDRLHDGMPPPDVVKSVTDNKPGVAAQEVATALVAAQRSYCPDTVGRWQASGRPRPVGGDAVP